MHFATSCSCTCMHASSLVLQERGGAHFVWGDAIVPPPPSFPGPLSVCYDHHFKDDYLFYRFKCDEKDKSNGFLNRLSLKNTSTKRKGSTPASSPEVGEKFLYSIGDTSATSPTIERSVQSRSITPEQYGLVFLFVVWCSQKPLDTCSGTM